MYDRVNMVHQVHGRGMHLVKNRSDLILGQKKNTLIFYRKKEKKKREAKYKQNWSSSITTMIFCQEQSGNFSFSRVSDIKISQC